MSTEQAVVRNVSMRLQQSTGALAEQSHYGIDITTGQLTLLDCCVTSLSLSCIGIHGKDSDSIIRRCTLQNSTQAGVLVKESGHAVLEDCTIAGNTIAVEVWQESGITLRRCAIRDHTKFGVFVHIGATAQVEDCVLSACSDGVVVSQEGIAAVKRCRLGDMKSDGIYVGPTATATVEHCEITACENGVHSEGGTITLRHTVVRDSRDDGAWFRKAARATLEYCTFSASAKIGVLANNTDTVVDMQECTITAGMHGLCIANSATLTAGACRIVDNTAFGVVAYDAIVTLGECAVASLLSGPNEMRGGTITLEKCDVSGADGKSALHGVNGTIFTLRDCAIHDSGDQGIALHNSQATVDECRIHGHVYQGVRLEEGSSITIRGGQIYANKTVGLSVDSKSRAHIEGCTVFGNGFNGDDHYSQIWIGHESASTLIRCTIRDGARDGIAFQYQSSGTVEGCAIYGNARDGIWIGEGSTPTIRRCQINRNAYNAITVKKDCPAVIEDCDLTQNPKGGWDVPLFGVRGLKRARNTE